MIHDNREQNGFIKGLVASDILDEQGDNEILELLRLKGALTIGYRLKGSVMRAASEVLRKEYCAGLIFLLDRHFAP